MSTNETTRERANAVVTRAGPETKEERDARHAAQDLSAESLIAEISREIPRVRTALRLIGTLIDQVCKGSPDLEKATTKAVTFLMLVDDMSLLAILIQETQAPIGFIGLRVARHLAHQFALPENEQETLLQQIEATSDTQPRINIEVAKVLVKHHVMIAECLDRVFEIVDEFKMYDDVQIPMTMIEDVAEGFVRVVHPVLMRSKSDGDDDGWPSRWPRILKELRMLPTGGVSIRNEHLAHLAHELADYIETELAPRFSFIADALGDRDSLLYTMHFISTFEKYAATTTTLGVASIAMLLVMRLGMYLDQYRMFITTNEKAVLSERAGIDEYFNRFIKPVHDAVAVLGPYAESVRKSMQAFTEHNTKAVVETLRKIYNVIADDTLAYVKSIESETCITEKDFRYGGALLFTIAAIAFDGALSTIPGLAEPNE